MQVVVQRAELFVRPDFDRVTDGDLVAVVWAAQMTDQLIFGRIPVSFNRPVIAPQGIAAGGGDTGRFEDSPSGPEALPRQQKAERPAIQRRRAPLFERADDFSVADAGHRRKFAHVQCFDKIGDDIAFDDLHVVVGSLADLPAARLHRFKNAAGLAQARQLLAAARTIPIDDEQHSRVSRRCSTWRARIVGVGHVACRSGIGKGDWPLTCATGRIFCRRNFSGGDNPKEEGDRQCMARHGGMRSPDAGPGGAHVRSRQRFVDVSRISRQSSDRTPNPGGGLLFFRVRPCDRTDSRQSMYSKQASVGWFAGTFGRQKRYFRGSSPVASPGPGCPSAEHGNLTELPVMKTRVVAISLVTLLALAAGLTVYSGGLSSLLGSRSPDKTSPLGPATAGETGDPKRSSGKRPASSIP